MARIEPPRNEIIGPNGEVIATPRTVLDDHSPLTAYYSLFVSEELKYIDAFRAAVEEACAFAREQDGESEGFATDDPGPLGTILPFG